MVTWLSNRSLSTYLDVHQCPGVWPENTNYAKVAKAMGMTDQQIADKENIRVLVENRTFNREFFNTLLQDQVGDNVYYWIDLCMGAEGYTKLPLWRFNWPLWNLWMFYNDMERRTGQHSILTKSTIPPAFSFVYCYVHGCTGTVAPPSGPSGVIRIELIATSCYLQCMLMRVCVCGRAPMLYAVIVGRGGNLAWFGGLGSQRYPLGHSGDVIMSWGSLQFQPRFTATAANINFGYWSHDLGGHRPAATSDVSYDPELYTRWLQWGTFAPTLRTHMEHGTDITLSKGIAVKGGWGGE